MFKCWVVIKLIGNQASVAMCLEELVLGNQRGKSVLKWLSVGQASKRMQWC